MTAPSAPSVHADEAPRVSFVVQSRSGDGIWEDHYGFPEDRETQRDRALHMAECMVEDYRGPWRVVRRIITDEQVFDARSATEEGASS